MPKTKKLRKDNAVKLVATSASAGSPVKLKAQSAALSARDVLLIIATIRKVMAFIEGPIGQSVISYIRESKDHGFRAKIAAFGQKLTHAASGPANSGLNEDRNPTEAPYNRPGHD